MTRIRITGPARRDIARALRRSGEMFGDQARPRYKRLFDAELADLAVDPARPGVRTIDEIRDGYFTYHLKSSRVPDASVRQPRHLVAFYINDVGDVIVARIFHERQMLARYLGS